MNKNIFLPALLTLAGAFASSAAFAIPVTSQQCSPVGNDSRTITIDPGLACVAKGTGNNANNSVFQSAVDGWTLIGNEEQGQNAAAFNVSLGVTSGTLSFNSNLWDLYSEILVVLKVGNAHYDPDWALFSLSDEATLFNWSVSPDKAGALSHATLYGRQASVPEPATLGLLGLGLLGIAASRRRRT